MEENKFYEICKDLDEVKNYNFSNVDEKEIELQGVDINKCKFKNCKIIDSNFEGSSFSNIEFQNCDFSNNKFVGTSFVRVKFKNCKLIGCDFTESSLYDINIEVENIEELNKVIRAIKKVDSVYEVRR